MIYFRTFADDDVLLLDCEIKLFWRRRLNLSLDDDVASDLNVFLCSYDISFLIPNESNL